MMDGSTFRNAIEAIQHIKDAAVPWADILLTAKELVGADAATLLMFNGQQDLLLIQQTGVDSAAEREYVDHYYKTDAIAQAAARSPAGRWWDSAQLQEVQEARRLPFFWDYMPRHRMGQILAYVVIGESERRAAISFQRVTADSSALDALSRGKVGVYMRALASAIAAREKTGRLEFEAVEATLSGIGDATLLAGPNGNIYRCSANSYEILSKAKMLAQRERTLTHPRGDVIGGLVAALTRAALLQERTTFAAPTSWGEGIRFDIIPAPPVYKLASESILLVRMRRSSAFTVPELGELASFFSLTPAEAKTLSALIAGHSPQEYSLSSGSAERTVRNHIASLMRKMSCSRQSELVRLGSLLR